jgi:hypothetical protein
MHATVAAGSLVNLFFYHATQIKNKKTEKIKKVKKNKKIKK